MEKNVKSGNIELGSWCVFFLLTHDGSRVEGASSTGILLGTTRLDLFRTSFAKDYLDHRFCAHHKQSTLPNC